MQHTSHAATLKLHGIAAIGSGVLFGATVVYLFGVLPRVGFTFAMLDNRALLLPWVAKQERLYGGLWVLYFFAQAVLLPVPGALRCVITDDGWSAAVASFCAKVGYAAILLAMVGLIVIYTTTPLVARAYTDAFVSPARAATVLLLGDVFADVGKELRLFSELLLGLWLGGTGVVLRRHARSAVAPWVMCAIGTYTLLVAGLKIADPFNPLEDTLALFLALGSIVIGIELVRQSQGRVGGDQATARPGKRSLHPRRGSEPQEPETQEQST